MYEELATALMFTKVLVSEFGTKFKLEFRKGKTVQDLNKALMKAARNGRGKVEFEVDMLELYLKDVLKPIKTTKEEG